jgi:hypothetical protein
VVVLAFFLGFQVSGIYKLESPAAERMSFTAKFAGDVPLFRPTLARFVFAVVKIMPETKRAIRDTVIVNQPTKNR